MKSIVSLAFLLILTSAQSQLFDQAIAGPGLTYIIPPSIVPSGFDNFNTAPAPTRFLETSTATEEVAPGFERSLANQAQNLISEVENTNIAPPAPTPPTESKKDLDQQDLRLKNLNIEGSLKVSGGLSIEKEGLRVTNETNFLLGDEKYSVGALLDMAKFASKIKSLCGENFERCAPVDFSKEPPKEPPKEPQPSSTETLKDPVAKDPKDPVKEDPAKDHAKEPVKETTKDPVKEPVKGPVKEDPVKEDPAKDQVKEQKKEQEMNNKKKGKKQAELSDSDLASNSIDLDTKAKEKEVEAAVEKVMSDEDTLTSYGDNKSES